MKNRKKLYNNDIINKILPIAKEIIKTEIVKNSLSKLPKEVLQKNSIWFIGFSLDNDFLIYFKPVYFDKDLFIDCLVKGINVGIMIFEDKILEPSDNLTIGTKIFLKHIRSCGIEVIDFFNLCNGKYKSVREFFD